MGQKPPITEIYRWEEAREEHGEPSGMTCCSVFQVMFKDTMGTVFTLVILLQGGVDAGVE